MSMQQNCKKGRLFCLELFEYRPLTLNHNLFFRKSQLFFVVSGLRLG